MIKHFELYFRINSQMFSLSRFISLSLSWKRSIIENQAHTIATSTLTVIFPENSFIRFKLLVFDFLSGFALLSSISTTLSSSSLLLLLLWLRLASFSLCSYQIGGIDLFKWLCDSTESKSFKQRPNKGKSSGQLNFVCCISIDCACERSIRNHIMPHRIALHCIVTAVLAVYTLSTCESYKVRLFKCARLGNIMCSCVESEVDRLSARENQKELKHQKHTSLLVYPFMSQIAVEKSQQEHILEWIK